MLTTLLQIKAAGETVMAKNKVWFRCESWKYGIRMYGMLTIEFEDAGKAREALRKMIVTLGRELEADKCELRKIERCNE